MMNNIYRKYTFDVYVRWCFACILGVFWDVWLLCLFQPTINHMKKIIQELSDSRLFTNFSRNSSKNIALSLAPKCLTPSLGLVPLLVPPLVVAPASLHHFHHSLFPSLIFSRLIISGLSPFPSLVSSILSSFSLGPKEIHPWPRPQFDRTLVVLRSLTFVRVPLYSFSCPPCATLPPL